MLKIEYAFIFLDINSQIFTHYEPDVEMENNYMEVSTQVSVTAGHS